MQTVTINNITEDKLPELASKLVHSFAKKEVIYLNGELGAGKTSLIRNILASLGYTGRVKSPSYSIAETYEFNNIKVAHLDLYRIDDLDELLYLSLDEYQQECDYLFIEWAPEDCSLVPTATMKIQILVAEGTRDYIIKRKS